MTRERELWTSYVREREPRQRPKRSPRIRKPKPGMSPAEMEAELDDLVREAEQRQAQSSGTT
jgi:hypothetical protein